MIKPVEEAARYLFRFSGRAMDLVSRIHRLPIGKFHYTLLWVIGLGWMFDAMDTGLISFILAKMAED